MEVGAAQETFAIQAIDQQPLMLETHRSMHAAMGRVRQSLREEHALLIGVRPVTPHYRQRHQLREGMGRGHHSGRYAGP